MSRLTQQPYNILHKINSETEILHLQTGKPNLAIKIPIITFVN